MILEIDQHGGVPIYRQIMNQIRRQIFAGQLKPGDQLESVKNLSARMKVNPMTISKAYGYLVEEGVVERRRGVGLFVSHVRRETRDRMKKKMLQEAIRKAATLAVQMNMSEQEALDLFIKEHRQLKSDKGRSER